MKKSNILKSNDILKKFAKLFTCFLLTSMTICLSESYAQDPNIQIGLGAPAYGVKIKVNYPTNVTWARGFSIVNENDTQKFFGIGVLGASSGGVAQMQYGYVGPAYNTGYMYFLPNGNVGIGTKTPGSKLAVNGLVQTREVKVTTAAADWPDFVFQPDYKLLPIDSLAVQIKELGYLPDMPSADKIKEDGISVGVIINTQQKKIEELTLYIIQQQEEMKRMKSQIETINKQLNNKK